MAKKQNKRNGSLQINSRTQIMQASYSSGPLPSADQLERYDIVLPGAANRIITMAEEQSKHRQELEKTVIKSNARDSLLGVIFAFVLCLSTIIIGGILAFNDHGTTGLIFCGVGLASLAGTFIYGTRSSKSERERNQQANR